MDGFFFCFSFPLGAETNAGCEAVILCPIKCFCPYYQVRAKHDKGWEYCFTGAIREGLLEDFCFVISMNVDSHIHNFAATDGSWFEILDGSLISLSFSLVPR